MKAPHLTADSLRPVGVLLPTRNSMARLPHHLETMREWLDLVEEVVVVDSESTDGTRELLRKELTGAKVRFFDHPPGLYESWNSGIRQIRSCYTYISTVGDFITREGLGYLVDTAERHKADVVASPPTLCDTHRQVRPDERWPIHELVSRRRINQSVAIAPSFVFCLAAFYALEHHLQGILGSSASNLYRTKTLHQRPFPTTVGTVGDVFWGVRNALALRFVVAPRCCTDFVCHDKGEWGLSSDKADALLRQVEQEVADTIERAGPSGERILGLAHARWLRQLLANRPEKRSLSGLQRQLDGLRKTPLWVMNPDAWRVRARRNVVRAQCRQFDPWLIPGTE